MLCFVLSVHSRGYVVALTLFHTGLRAAELAGLQWPDLDFRGRFITVRRQYKKGKVTRTKTKKIRKVDMSDVLLHELQSMKKRRQEEYLGRGKNEIPEWVFLSPGLRLKEGKREEGEPLDMKNFRNRIFLKACESSSFITLRSFYFERAVTVHRVVADCCTGISSSESVRLSALRAVSQRHPLP
jgi:integrase